MQALRNYETPEESEEVRIVVADMDETDAQQGTVNVFRDDRRVREDEKDTASTKRKPQSTIYEKRTQGTQNQGKQPGKGKGKKTLWWRLGPGLAALALIALAVGLIWHRMGGGETDDGELKVASHTVSVPTKDPVPTPSPTPSPTPVPTIITQPKSITVTAGETASFEVVASGSGLSYQWWYRKPGDTGWTAVKSNGSSATYTLATQERHNGYTYRCKVKNSFGSVESAEVTLTVIASTKPTPTEKSTAATAPGPSDMTGCDSRIAIPKTTSWLSEYKTRYIDGYYDQVVVVLASPYGDGIGYAEEAKEVVMLAVENGYALVTSNGFCIGWVHTNYLVEDYKNENHK